MQIRIAVDCNLAGTIPDQNPDRHTGPRQRDQDVCRQMLCRRRYSVSPCHRQIGIAEPRYKIDEFPSRAIPVVIRQFSYDLVLQIIKPAVRKICFRTAGR